MHAKPKKSLGQNFLIDGNIRRKIIDACELDKSDIILEIGAGRGELTELLCENAAMVYALEIDKDLCRLLEDKFKACKNIEVINADILRFDFAQYFDKTKARIKVVGNIPYYITSPIIEKLFEERDRFSSINLTVQKEFGRRITALAGSKEYGSFSCYVRYYTDPKINFLIKKNSFYPIPKVDSCFLRLIVRREPAIKLKDEKLFFQIIRAAFGKRRKILRNSLDGVVSMESLNIFFTRYNISPNVRPEELSLQDFAALVNNLKK